MMNAAERWETMDVRAEIHTLNRRISDLEKLLDIDAIRGARSKTIARKDDILKEFTNRCRSHDVTNDVVRGRRRDRVLAEKRMFIAKELYSIGFNKTEIAVVMNKDHTTIVNMVKLSDTHYRGKRHDTRHNTNTSPENDTR